MDKNDYGYRPGKNILLIMFDKDLSTYDGIEPLRHNSASITNKNYPLGTETSMKTNTYTYLRYSKDDLALGTKDFTMDFWMYPLSTYNGISSAEVGGGVGIGIQAGLAWVGSNLVGVGLKKIKFKSGWAHYAFVRLGTDYYCFINGKLADQVKGEILNITSKTLAVNARYNYPFYAGVNYIGSDAYYKAVRLCDFARWTSDFTVPIPTIPALMALYLKRNAIYGIQTQ